MAVLRVPLVSRVEEVVVGRSIAIDEGVGEGVAIGIGGIKLGDHTAHWQVFIKGQGRGGIELGRCRVGDFPESETEADTGSCGAGVSVDAVGRTQERPELSRSRPDDTVGARVARPSGSVCAPEL